MTDKLYTDPKLRRYRQAEDPLPEKYWLWPLYGAGIENLGQEGNPIEVDLPEPNDDELLVRHDACGLCFSDTKVIKAGPDHPRLGGRDMKNQPVVLGHEVILTVIKAGKNRPEFKPGQRYIVQADVYYKGVGLAYGYVLQGGLSQYNIVGAPVLDGDEGCYLLPVKETTGYAQAALTEPWACVTASYDVSYRSSWKLDGKVAIVAGPAAAFCCTKLGKPYIAGRAPASITTFGLSGALLDELRALAAADSIELVEKGAASEKALAGIDAQSYDDIVLLGVDPALYETMEVYAAKGGMINLVGGSKLDAPAPVDVGRLHYDNLAIVGTNSNVIADGYRPIRTNLKPGGKAVFIGAAGPMGQMHVQRAVQKEPGPALIVATDLVKERLDVIQEKYAHIIAKSSGRVELRVPSEGQSSAAFNESLVDMTDGTGFDDLVVLAPSPRVVEGAMPMAGQNAMINIFAGLARGTKANIALSAVTDKGIQFTGTSGSSITDLRKMLNAAESGELDPNMSVAAVSGLIGVKEGIEGVMHQSYPGKVVIYPQIRDLSVTRLEDLKTLLPKVYEKLGPQESWTIEAEEEFLKEMLP